MAVIENQQLTLAENKNRPPEVLLGQCVMTAWNDIFSESLVKQFKKILSINQYERSSS
jgi:hypothetical protein